jgi:hypothetical protein
MSKPPQARLNYYRRHRPRRTQRTAQKPLRHVLPPPHPKLVHHGQSRTIKNYEARTVHNPLR